MKNLSILAWLVVVLCIGSESLAWNSVADFESAATNALADVSILVSEDFGKELTNYIAAASNYEAKIAAQLVLGERHLASYNETLKESNLKDALGVASNVCSLTRTEESSWCRWHARLFLSTCLARNNQIERAYEVASNTVSCLGTQSVVTDNIVSVALLRYDRAQDLSIRQATVLANALFAAMLKKRCEATMLAQELPTRYREMVSRLVNGEEWIR